MTAAEGPPALEIAIAHRFEGFALDVAFTAPPGVTALFGRSGAGKTSIANALAGILRPEAGRIAVGGAALFDAAARIDVPRHRRRVGYVFQEGRLFPHLDVRRNLLFGRRFSRPDPEASAAPEPVLEDVAALLGLEPLLSRRPGGLSGGERQRVAIGRALLSRPRVLVMDEPLASLDAARKAEILPYLERLRDQSRVPILYVSHALDEVARLATTIVALSEGRVARLGPAEAVLSDPSAFPLLGRQEAGAVLAARLVTPDCGDGLSELEAGGVRLFAPKIDAPAGAALRLRVRARDVMIAAQRPEGVSALNILPAVVAAIGEEGADAAVDVALDCAGGALLARITRRSLKTLALAPGARCFAVVKAIAASRRDLGVLGGA